MPPVRTGTTVPPASVPSAPPKSGVLRYVPRDQGEVPWHRISDFRITDALVGRVSYSTGNLMLAATDFDVAGVGQSLQLTRTYNSFDAPSSSVSDPWWLGYERRLDLTFTGMVLHYDRTGATVEYTQNADGSLTTPQGYSHDLKKNADGTYTLTDRKSGTADTYGSNGALTKVTDRNKGEVTVAAHRSPEGQNTGFKLTETRSGRSVDLVRTSATRWDATDHTGRTVGYDLDAAGNVVRTTDAEGESTRFGYDADGRIIKVTTPENRSTSFTYDAADRVTSVRRYAEGSTGGPTYTYTYSAANAGDAGTTKVTDPLGHTTTYDHNGDGEVTKVVDGLGHERATTYQNRLVQTATDAMGTGSGGTGGNVTAYGWDARNNPTSTKLPTGATASSSWQTVAGVERPSNSKNADGEKTEFAYDAAGNTTSVATVGTGGATLQFTYNEATPTCGGFQGQRCTATDGNGQKTSFRYDATGNLQTVTPPAPLGVTRFTYDALGRTATATDPRGVKTLYTYDKRDRITKVDTSGYATVTYVYDGDGNLSSRTDATGVQTYQFDALSRETVRTLQDGSQTVLAYTADGDVDTYKDPGGVTDYSWDAAGRLSELTDPRGKKTVYEYDKNDRRTKTTYPGGTVQTQRLDNSGRPENIRALAPSGVVLSDLSYTYGYVSGQESLDGAKVRSRTDNVTKARTAYTYDGAGRTSLAEETETSGRKTSWQYCYDPAGNLTTQGGAPGCPAATAYTYNAASQLTAKNGVTSGWSYDKAGNETAGAPAPETARSAERYTDFGQLKSVTVGTTAYPAEYASTDSSERTRFGSTVFHNGPLGLSGQTAGGKDTEFIREPGGTLNSLHTGGKSHYYLTDALGSVIGLVDETGKRVNTYLYTPSGAARTGTQETVPQPFRFTGGYQDPTGMYHFGARYYDPQLGRFTQNDPSGQEKNPYLYAEGDPLNRIDPDGLLPKWVNGAADAVGKAMDVYDVATFASQLSKGQYKEAGGTAVGFAADKLFTAGCTAATGGTGAVGCAVGGYAVGQLAQKGYEKATG
ncbi:RHS repeat-associated core domain-containing protein [Streptomyces sp. NPDC058657]|uniref:RHS repeat-associated core domain-containing protein n=1 Tax=unclassified Streptomyces TaxID=2593676 RepID=UPI00364B6F71